MSTNGAKILLLEDEFIIAEMMKDALEWAGLGPCVHAATVQSALQLLADSEWAGAFVDINVKSEVSFPVAQALSARGIPFAFCSGDASRTVIPSEFSGVPVLLKPWPPGALEAMVKRLLSAAN